MFRCIFTCSAHQFEEELKADVYKQLKVNFKEGKQDFPNPKYASLTIDEISTKWQQALEENNLEFFVFVMKTLPRVDLDKLDPLHEVFFETHIHHPDVNDYLKAQYSHLIFN